MESIRNFLKSWPGRIFLMLCLSPLAILGLESYFSGGTSVNEVAKVGEQSISRMDYQNSINTRRTELLEGGVEASAINTNVLNKEVLKSLINRALLRNQTEQLGMHVSDSVINNILLQDPQYLDQDGQFSNDRFAFALQQQGITKDQLFAEYRQQLNLMQLYASVAQTALYPEADINDLLALQLETRDAWVYRLPWEQFQDKVTVSQAEIENYYNEHKNDLNSLAMVDLSYIKLDPEALTVSPVTEDEIQAQYDAYKARFVGNYTQQISQILITGDKAQDTIKQLEQRIKDGEDFAALAKEYSADSVSAPKGGDIGTFNPDAFGEDGQKVAKAIESLSVGQVSAPVKTSFGYQLFKVTKMSGDDMPTLEQMREELTAQAERQKKEELIADKIMRINDMATDGVGIEEIAAQEELTVHKLKDYTKVNNQTELRQPAVIEAAFDDFTIQDESVSPSVKVNSGTLWVQPTNYRPVAPLTLAEATAQIKETLTKQKASELALVEAKRIMETVNDKGMSAASVTFSPLGKINRQNPLLTTEEKAMAFSQDTEGDKLLSVSDITDTGATVLVLGSIDKGSMKDVPQAELAQVMFDMRDTRGQEQFSDYIEYLRVSTPIKENEAVINEVGGL
ncbi:SurA N-terminal domain-containing protein [Psychrobacter sp. FDAARGOS_221]|uniref:SurA N-terminal domain-containing protein n=1 Tax=Psychrobacter sp. FDAARGOS_221 TaxID=1975705 RepID=UPI000BB54D18|nr:SurA N-terminal domain-containing protein [Psychrobacter sp. FDAARGOS_221]PNK59980.1 peptidylprolyl isomerase [Psychrobacter sp. FDAARGOS_221]